MLSRDTLVRLTMLELQETLLHSPSQNLDLRQHARQNLLSDDRRAIAPIKPPPLDFSRHSIDERVLQLFDLYRDEISHHIDHLPLQSVMMHASHVADALQHSVCSHQEFSFDQTTLIKEHLFRGAGTARTFIRAMCNSLNAVYQDEILVLDMLQNNYAAVIQPFMSIRQTTLMLMSGCLIPDELTPTIPFDIFESDRSQGRLALNYAKLTLALENFLGSLSEDDYQGLVELMEAGASLPVFGCPALKGAIVKQILRALRESYQ